MCCAQTRTASKIITISVKYCLDNFGGYPFEWVWAMKYERNGKYVNGVECVAWNLRFLWQNIFFLVVA